MAVALLAAALVAGRSHAGALLDWLIGRYPGAARAAGGTVDLDYLGRGWLSRRAVYVTNTETLAVELWYRGRYGPVTEAEAFDGAHCTGFRTSKLLVRIVYAVAVSVCPVPAGTRIVVDESAFFSPASPGPPAP
jgi:hypothetical protein